MFGKGKLISRALNLTKPLMQQVSTESKEVIFRTVKDKGIIILNRPNRLNTYTLSMLQQITNQLKLWNKEANLVLIKGAGGKAFCAGGDLKFVIETTKNNDPLFHKYATAEYRSLWNIHSLQVPYVSFLDGIVMGGGGGLSVTGQYRVATENTVFAMPETSIGIIPDNGVSYCFSRMKNNLGLFLGLTGIHLRGIDVFHAGIATHTCDSKRLQELEEELLDLDMYRLWKLGVSNSVAVEDVLNRYTKETEFGRGQPFKFASEMDKISFVFGAETVEEIIERLKKDESEWGRRTLKILERACPISLKAALRQLREIQNKSFLEALILEYRINTYLCHEYNLFEGVRAAVVDKDRNPKWQPSSLEKVSDAMIERYFQPLPEGLEITFE